jgi:quercetin dioxygenase-like cupin family protein
MIANARILGYKTTRICLHFAPRYKDVEIFPSRKRTGDAARDGTRTVIKTVSFYTMHVKHYEEVEKTEVHADGAENVYIQWLIDESTGKNFAMRRFELLPDGHTPRHEHDWEHEVFVLEGDGSIVDPDGTEHALRPGSFAYVAPGERHQFKNTGTTPFVFLCLIPLA